jgi:hypothetical protein
MDEGKRSSTGGCSMNIDQGIQILQVADYRFIMFAIFFVISLIMAGFNLIYLNQSLHVTSHHMGIKAPHYLKHLLKAGIFIAFMSAGFSLFILITGMY